ncbi:MAG: flavin reductase family protein [Gemmatimonadota bacterium]|nr:flavin reductase family protein [Gemmatimonadota bacterium]
MPFDPAAFRSVLGRFASGVTVVTARDARGTDHGMTVSSFCSLSLDPALVLLCVEHSAEMHAVLQEASTFAINILSSAQEPLARRFAEVMPDRFDGIGFARGTTGVALLADVLGTIECERRESFPGGDHTIFTGEVVTASSSAGRPLLYYRGGYAQLER